MKKRKTRQPKQQKKKRIDLKIEDLEQLLVRVESGKLDKGDLELIRAMAECIVFLSQSIDEKAVKIKRLLRMIFGASTESKQNIVNDQEKASEADDENSSKPTKPADTAKNKNAKPKGHGRNGADDYPGAERVVVGHADLKSGDTCPDCQEGKLYKITEPGLEIRVTGSAPLRATVYELEKLRCALCGNLFTAAMPAKAGKKKYDAAAVAMIALLKYGSGLPFNRLDRLQANLGAPLPRSTQWDIINEADTFIRPAYQELIRQAAQGEIFHNDDTNIKILSLIKENAQDTPERKGMFTTGVVSVADGRKIALYFTGRRHAGENMDVVLADRDRELQTPLQMCDALSRNAPAEFATILMHCLIHARRNFVDAAVNFPQECAYVIEALSEVYLFDAEAKKQRMAPNERLEHHQRSSGPVMDKLHAWLNDQIDSKKAEPNSCLGSAIAYMLKHWPRLTAFLRIPNAPLDNNIAERILKKAILHRKNALFFKTEHGAVVGDRYMSLIHTCELSGVNAFEYLKSLIEYTSSVQESPSDWMPWNFATTLARLQG